MGKSPLAPGWKCSLVSLRSRPANQGRLRIYGQFREEKEFQIACEIQAPGEKSVAPKGDEGACQAVEAREEICDEKASRQSDQEKCGAGQQAFESQRRSKKFRFQPRNQRIARGPEQQAAEARSFRARAEGEAFEFARRNGRFDGRRGEGQSSFAR